MLSLRPLVFIGLISYSLYLWHWPLIVFQRTDAILLAHASGLTGKLLLIGAAMLLAWLSWRFVELPFRSTARASSRVMVFGTALAAMAASVALCALVLLEGGVPFRFPARVVSIAAYLGYDPSDAFRSGRCYLATNRQRLDLDTCLLLDPKRPNYLLVGDSHAAQLWLGLSAAMPEINLMQATASACRPAVEPTALLDTRACPRLMQFVFDDFFVNTKVDKVLLGAAWKDEDLPGLSVTLDALKQRGIDRHGPRADRRIRQGLAAVARRRDHARRSCDRKHHAHARHPGARPRDGKTGRRQGRVLCVGLRCGLQGWRLRRIRRWHVPMQFDAGHLTARGSIEVGQRLKASFVKMLARADHAPN